MKNEILYSKAYDEFNDIIDIKNINKDEYLKSKIKYTCISCSERLIPRIGDVRQKHFAHESNHNHCSSESYLHELAKRSLFDNLKNSIKNKQPFVLKTIQHKYCKKCNFAPRHYCNQGEIKFERDILLKYKNVNIEEKDDNFKPDIILSTEDGREKLWIEICVTHKVSPQKKASKNKIIEIEIYSEADIEPLNADHLDLTKPNIKSYNIKIPNLYIDNDLKECTWKKYNDSEAEIIYTKKGVYAYIDEKGKVHFKYLTESEIIQKQQADLKYFKPIHKRNIDQYTNYIISAKKAGITPLQHCLICYNKQILTSNGKKYISCPKIRFKIGDSQSIEDNSFICNNFKMSTF
jgi:hypothetical protein